MKHILLTISLILGSKINEFYKKYQEAWDDQDISAMLNYIILTIKEFSCKRY